jgi:D-galactosaminyltransferase
MPGCAFAAHAVLRPGHLRSHTSPVSLGIGVLIALLLLVIPGAIVARIGRLTWPAAVAVGPALTFGVVALAIVPLGALGVPWNAWTALFATAVAAGAALCLRVMLARFRDVDAESRAVSGGAAVVVAAGVVLGAALIGLAAVRGMPQWQSIPSN